MDNGHIYIYIINNYSCITIDYVHDNKYNLL